MTNPGPFARDREIVGGVETPGSLPAADRPWRYVPDAGRVSCTPLTLATGSKWERNLPARILPCTLTHQLDVSFHRRHTNVVQMRKLPAPTRRFPWHQNRLYEISPTANEVPSILTDRSKICRLNCTRRIPLKCCKSTRCVVASPNGIAI